MIGVVRRRLNHDLGIETVDGDIMQPNLGFSSSTMRQLGDRVGCILHMAALTDLGAREDELFRLNVEGTQNVVQLAATLQTRVCYVSTAFIAPRPSVRSSPYDGSKRAAESVVKNSGVRWCVVRPSILIGDSTTGWMPRFQGFHKVITMIVRGALPVLPVTPDDCFDLMPIDVCADIIDRLVATDAAGEHWITAGTGALTASDVVDVCGRFAHHMGQSLDPPRFVDADLIDRLIAPAFGDVIPTRLMGALRMLDQFSAYANILEALPCSTERLLDRFRLGPMPDPKAALFKNLEYWAALTGYRQRHGTSGWGL